MGSGSAMEALRITTERGDGWYRVVPVGDVDIAVAYQLGTAIMAVAGSTVVVDLSGVTFIDASGVAALVDAQRQVEAGGSRMELRGAQGIVRRVFEIVGLQDWLTDEPAPTG
ncbi:MAG TPA: STAS domain-containing protein [Acidimicrobiales bacterium]|nr:STAS domain-containing protein [Acidimicrobiales bacterium]